MMDKISELSSQETTDEIRDRHSKDVTGTTGILAILSSSESIQDVLDHMTHSLCSRWKARRCAIFLFNESSQRMTLRAVYGGMPDLVGKLSFGLGEGLSGTSLAERRIIYTAAPGKDPIFMPRPKLPIDLLGPLVVVPVMRGEERVGVFALQRVIGVPFTQSEINKLAADAVEIAGALENARALMLAAAKSKEKPGNSETTASNDEVTLLGIAVSKGIGIGKSRILARTRAATAIDGYRTSKDRSVVFTLDEAIARTEEQIHHYQSSFEKTLPEATALIFEAQLLMLKDDNFVGKIRTLIDNGTPEKQAIAKTAADFISFFEASPHDYLKEKSRDVEDLALRLLENLSSKTQEDEKLNDAQIVVTAELLPSDILRLAQTNIQGIVLVGGGGTAHVTLLVRSLGIPMVMIENTELLHISNNETMIVDCESASVVLRPKEQTLKKCRDRKNGTSKESLVSPDNKTETKTRDGQLISLMANINLLAELDIAKINGADGIGLYRTEFPFLMRTSLPSEDEQLNLYLKLLDKFPDKPVIFRTLDAGGDKVLSYFDQAQEENPALGLRSTRFTLRYSYIFNQQLRAILRAVQLRQRNDIGIMFPMIGSLEELDSARARLFSCMEQVKIRGGDFPAIMPKIGVMIELPAMIYLAADAMRESAFVSIGTNDFIQYMLAADRTNSQVAGYYIPHHPAVLHGLKLILDAAIKTETPLSICGEMGRDPKYIPFLLGIGVRKFSVEPSQINNVRDQIAKISIPEAEAHAKSILAHHRIAEIESIIKKMLDRYDVHVRNETQV